MKKKVLFIVVLMLCMFYMPSVLAANVKGCEAILPNVAIDVKIANTVHTVIVAIKVVVPILLVIYGMLDLFKGIMAQKEDEIKKGQQIFIKRLISGAIIFFVISIVQLLVSFVGNDDGGLMDCASCFLRGTDVNGKCK